MAASADSRLTALSREYRPALMAFFMRRVRDHAEAEDLTQEVFARLAASPDQARDPERYMFRIAGNLVNDRSRRSKVRQDYRRGLTADDEAGVETIDPERLLVSREAVDRIETVLRDLPDRTRAIFLLFRLEGVPRQEIAYHFGISVSAVDKHLGKAMARVMDSLGDER